jgi:hypothetical protein
MAGVVGLELRNVGANYPFERSTDFQETERIPATETIRFKNIGSGAAMFNSGWIKSADDKAFNRPTREAPRRTKPT